MLISRRLAAALLALPLFNTVVEAQTADPARTLVVAVPSDAVGIEPATNRAEPIGSEVILNVFDTLVAWTAPDFAKLEGAPGAELEGLA